MKKIAAADVFFTPEHREQIEKTAAECGYSVDFYPDGHLPPERAAEYEIVYGCCLPGELIMKICCICFCGVLLVSGVVNYNKLHQTTTVCVIVCR